MATKMVHLCHRAQLLSAMVALLYPICPLATRMLFHNLSFVFCAFCRVLQRKRFREPAMFFTGGHFALRRRLWYNKAIHY